MVLTPVNTQGAACQLRRGTYLARGGHRPALALPVIPPDSGRVSLESPAGHKNMA